MTGPLVAEPKPTGQFEGAGLLSDVADTVKGFQEGDPGTGLAAASGVLNLISTIDDPLTAFTSAGLGWAIEHFAFLREPLNALTGDAAQIQAHAHTWQNIANHLKDTADQRQQGLATLPTWQGEAATAYRDSAAKQVQAMRDASTSAAQLSQQIMINGELVATERALIRDLIAKFVSDAIYSFFVAAALAVESVGGSVAAWLAKEVLQAVRLAADLAKRVATLLDKLAKAAGTLAKLGEKVAKLSEGLSAPAHDLAKTADNLERAAERAGKLEAGARKAPIWEPPAPMAAGVEAGKQVNSGQRDLDEWRKPEQRR